MKSLQNNIIYMNKTTGVIVAIIFIILGVLGFIQNPLIGNEAFFKAGDAHSSVLLLSGLIILAVSLFAVGKVGSTLKTFGALYVLIAILGFILVAIDNSGPMLAGIATATTPDNWLHLILGLVTGVAGFVVKGEEMPVVM